MTSLAGTVGFIDIAMQVKVAAKLSLFWNITSLMEKKIIICFKKALIYFCQRNNLLRMCMSVCACKTDSGHKEKADIIST